MLPHCFALSRGRWALQLPSNGSGNTANSQKYVQHAHGYLRRKGVKQWIIDLRSDSGGDASIQIAALAPLLGSGKQLEYINAESSRIPVNTTTHSVAVGGKTRFRWQGGLVHVGVPAIFVIGPSCGSACEAFALAAKGKATAGLTSANELLTINDQVAMPATSGLMADRVGSTVYPRGVQPDEVLSDAAVEQLFGTAETESFRGG